MRHYPMLGAVLFDLGDTLFDLNTHDPRRYLAPGVEQAYRDLLDQGYRLPPREQYLKRVFRSMTLAYFWSQLTLREIDLLALIRKTHRRWKVDLDRATAERYARACHQPIREVFVAAEGAAGVLERVRQAGYAIGLVSNTFMLPKALDEDLEAAGMLDYFACRVY
ncbi:MAG: hypothetical protein IID40_10050, partial [Planctomycetes bacterium]|nr:hypothetical protein [Planctomycetota bacterium]